MAFLFFILLVIASHFVLTAVRRALVGERDRRAEIQRAAAHQRYHLFRQGREASRALIQQQVAAEGQAFELMLLTRQQEREDRRRRLAPDWDLVGLLRQQNRISHEEYWAYCLDSTGEYCPALLAE